MSGFRIEGVWGKGCFKFRVLMICCRSRSLFLLERGLGFRVNSRFAVAHVNAAAVSFCSRETGCQVSGLRVCETLIDGRHATDELNPDKLKNQGMPAIKTALISFRGWGLGNADNESSLLRYPQGTDGLIPCPKR